MSRCSIWLKNRQTIESIDFHAEWPYIDLMNKLDSPQIGADGSGGDILSPQDPPLFDHLNAASDRPFFMICDHAGRAIPEKLGKLGLGPEHFDRHVSFDIGAASLTRLLSQRLGAPAILATYSRLLIDLNRAPGDPGSIPAISDGLVIPGNQNLSEADQINRVEAFFWPYHNAVSDALAHLWRMGPPPALFSIHSFTPKMDTGEQRPWDIGILWNRDPRIAVPLIEKLEARGDLVVGDNEPYSGKEIAYSIDMHAGAPGLANCAIEVRQDLISDDKGIERWADILVPVLEDILQMASIHQVETY